MDKLTKLKLSWWQELLYLFFVMLVPVVIAVIEIFHSHSTVFKISFSSVGCILLVAILVRRFVFKSKIEKLREKCVLDEHDYESGVGDADKIRHNWTIKNIIIYAYNAIIILLSMILAILFVEALANQIIQFKGASIIIFASVLLGMMIRLIIFLALLKEKKNV